MRLQHIKLKIYKNYSVLDSSALEPCQSTDHASKIIAAIPGFQTEMETKRQNLRTAALKKESLKNPYRLTDWQRSWEMFSKWNNLTWHSILKMWNIYKTIFFFFKSVLLWWVTAFKIIVGDSWEIIWSSNLLQSLKSCTVELLEIISVLNVCLNVLLVLASTKKNIS